MCIRICIGAAEDGGCGKCITFQREKINLQTGLGIQTWKLFEAKEGQQQQKKYNQLLEKRAWES